MLCRSQGVACIDGDQYFRLMSHVGGGWHVGKRNTESYKIYLKLVEHVRNVAYAIWPHGTFAAQQSVPHTPARPADFPRQIWQTSQGKICGRNTNAGW